MMIKISLIAFIIKLQMRKFTDATAKLKGGQLGAQLDLGVIMISLRELMIMEFCKVISTL